MENPFRISSSQRIALCPGSVAACSCLPKGQPGPEAERGTRIHAALAAHFTSSPLPELNGEESECCEMLIGMTCRLVETLGGIDGSPLCEVEVSAGGWTGHLDYMAMLKSGDILVVDWKTGRGEVADASENAQLRGYAVGAVRKATELGWCYGGQAVVAIVQPFERVEPCRYSVGDIDAAERELEAWRAEAEKEGALRFPSPTACRYCPAKGTSRCPETAELPAALAKVAETVTLATMDGDRLAALISAAEIVAKLADEAEAEAKKRLAEGQEVGDLALGKPRTTRSLKSTMAAVGRLEGMGIQPKAIFGFCSLSIPKVEAAMGKAEAQAALADLIETKEGQPPLVRRKVEFAAISAE